MGTQIKPGAVKSIGVERIDTDLKIMYYDVESMPEDKFEWYGEESRNGWPWAYFRRSETSWFYSPDGIGRIFFDSLAELDSEVGLEYA
jgi:hypothetical protein